MRRSIPAPTVAQQKRQDIIREIGCVCCALVGHLGEPCEIQHMNDCGRNISQDHTFGLCAWHHRGIRKNDLSMDVMRELYGPSFAIDKRDFRSRYGDDGYLLDVQNKMVETYRRCGT